MSQKTIRNKLLEKAVCKVDEKILDHIITNFDAVTFMSAERLRYAAGCTEQELQQFCAGFGADNLMELMAVVRDVMYGEMEEMVGDRERALRDITDKMVRYEMNNIAEYSANLDVDLVDRLAQDMVAASEVYIVGVRSSGPMSTYAAHILNEAGVRTRKIDVAENYVDGVVNMEMSGLVLALDFTRYHKGTLLLLHMLRKNGFNIVAITDSPDAPAARVANYSICVPRRSHDYTDSFVTTTMLLNTLAVYIGMQDKDTLVSRLRQYDEITQGLEVFF